MFNDFLWPFVSCLYSLRAVVSVRFPFGLSIYKHLSTVRRPTPRETNRWSRRVIRIWRDTMTARHKACFNNDALYQPTEEPHQLSLSPLWCSPFFAVDADGTVFDDEAYRSALSLSLPLCLCNDEPSRRRRRRRWYLIYLCLAAVVVIVYPENFASFRGVCSNKDKERTGLE